MVIETTKEMVSKVYEQSNKRLDVVRGRLNRPLTLAEKVLFGHLADPQNQERVATKNHRRQSASSPTFDIDGPKAEGKHQHGQAAGQHHIADGP